jgi:hypothetical protein
VVVGLVLAWWISHWVGEAPPAASVPHRIKVQIGQNHFEAEGYAEDVKQQFSTFLANINPPPPETPTPETPAVEAVSAPSLNLEPGQPHRD